jgi:hypothetical protein
MKKINKLLLISLSSMSAFFFGYLLNQERSVLDKTNLLDFDVARADFVSTSCESCTGCGPNGGDACGSGDTSGGCE